MELGVRLEVVSTDGPDLQSQPIDGLPFAFEDQPVACRTLLTGRSSRGVEAPDDRSPMLRNVRELVQFSIGGTILNRVPKARVELRLDRVDLRVELGLRKIT